MSTDSKRRDRRNSQGIALVAACWLATRLLILVVIWWTCQSAQISFEQAVTHWDVQHYMQIGRDGYADPQNMAFFPGLPLLLRGFEVIGIPMWLAGLLIANVSSALATAALYRMYGVPAACLWTIAPMTVFTFVPYTEAPFCAAAFWAWQRAREDRWGQAAALTALACALRISGLFLIAGLGILALTRSSAEMAERAGDKKFLDRLLDAAWLLLPAAVIVGYAAFLHAQTGSWLAWYSSQSDGWQRSITWPWESLKTTWPLTKDSAWPGRPEVAPMFRLEIVAAAIGYLGLLITLAKRRWGEMTWLAANMFALTCSGWFISVTRGILIWFPIYRLLGEAVEKRPANKSADQLLRVAGILLLVCDLGLLCWWTHTFARGGWAT